MEDIVADLRGPPGPPGVGQTGRPGPPGAQGLQGTSTADTMTLILDTSKKHINLEQ